MKPFSWDNEAILNLTRLWTEGHTCVAIAKAIGVSKCAVVGKAHRLKLTSRPSPIRSGLGKRPEAMARPKKAPIILPVTTANFPLIRTRKNEPCCYATETGVDVPGKRWKYCNEPTSNGPYCAKHSEKMYVSKTPTLRSGYV